MDQLTITGTATYGNETLTGSATINVREVVSGVMDVTTTYALLADTTTSPAQFIVVTNAGAVDIAVRLKFGTNKYVPFTVPPSCTIILPIVINANAAEPDVVEDVYVRSVSGTVSVEYVVIR